MKKLFKSLLSLSVIFAISVPVFAADNTLSRYEMISILNETSHTYTVGPNDRFNDVPIDSPYFYVTAAAKNQGYIQGYLDNTVHPEENATRTHAAVAIDRLFSIPEATLDFKDKGSIPSWAVKSIEKVVAAGIMDLDENGAFNAEELFNQDQLDKALKILSDKKFIKRIDEIMDIESFDGYMLKGRLSTPTKKEKFEKLVIFVDGTGPDTYEMKRQANQVGVGFKYTDTFADAFIDEGVAYFSYNTRGVDLSEEDPFYKITPEGYKTYTPQNVAKDLGVIVNKFKADPRFSDAEIILFGWSEGAVIAPLAVTEYQVKADTLILAGYPNENMKEILEYQFGGEMSLFNYKLLLGVTEGDSISKKQFEETSQDIKDFYLPGITFEHLDLDGDGYLTLADFSIIMTPTKDGLFTAIENGDDNWIAENMAGMIPTLYTDWFRGHFELDKTEDIMTKVNIPIYIFHGTLDANCPVQGVLDVQKRFENEGKTNLTVNIYDGFNHDLNYENWIYGSGSVAIDEIIETISGLS